MSAKKKNLKRLLIHSLIQMNNTSSSDTVNAADSSVQSLYMSLAINGAVAGVALVVFILLRWKLKRFYAPYCFANGITDEARPSYPKGLFAWTIPTFGHSTDKLQRTRGTDQAMIIVVLELLLSISAVLCLVGPPILIPIHATASNKDLPRTDPVCPSIPWFKRGYDSLRVTFIIAYQYVRFRDLLKVSPFCLCQMFLKRTTACGLICF